MRHFCGSWFSRVAPLGLLWGATHAALGSEGEYRGVVVAMHGIALYRSSHSDTQAKTVRAGMSYYPGYEFQVKRGWLTMRDLNAGGDTVLRSHTGRWVRASLGLNTTQQDLVSKLSKLEWSISRSGGSDLVLFPSGIAQCPLDRLMVVRRPSGLTTPLKVSVLAGDDAHLLTTEDLNNGKPVTVLSKATREAISAATRDDDALITLRFTAPGETFDRRVHLMSKADAGALDAALAKCAATPNRLSRALGEASVYASARCDDLWASSLLDLSDAIYQVPGLAKLRDHYAFLFAEVN